MLAGWLGSLPKTTRTRLLSSLPRGAAYLIEHDWPLRARPSQLPPDGDWRVWLLLAGRGFGKTRTGAEMVRARVAEHRAHHIALVAPTAADARDVMIEGESGLLAVSLLRDWPVYEPSKRRLTWPNGAVATTCESEGAQLAAFAAFCRHGGLDRFLRSHDWTHFALGYNGPGEAENDYAGKLAAAYQRRAASAA